MLLIDLGIKEGYTKEVYNKAVDIFIQNYANKLGSTFGMTNDELSQFYHKAKSGALMLGFSRLGEALKQCEATPEDQDLREQMVACLNETLNLFEEKYSH